MNIFFKRIITPFLFALSISSQPLFAMDDAGGSGSGDAPMEQAQETDEQALTAAREARAAAIDQSHRADELAMEGDEEEKRRQAAQAERRARAAAAKERALNAQKIRQEKLAAKNSGITGERSTGASCSSSDASSSSEQAAENCVFCLETVKPEDSFVSAACTPTHHPMHHLCVMRHIDADDHIEIPVGGGNGMSVPGRSLVATSPCCPQCFNAFPADAITTAPIAGWLARITAELRAEDEDERYLFLYKTLNKRLPAIAAYLTSASDEIAAVSMAFLAEIINGYSEWIEQPGLEATLRGLTVRFNQDRNEADRILVLELIQVIIDNFTESRTVPPAGACSSILEIVIAGLNLETTAINIYRDRRTDIERILGRILQKIVQLPDEQSPDPYFGSDIVNYLVSAAREPSCTFRQSFAALPEPIRKVLIILNFKRFMSNDELIKATAFKHICEMSLYYRGTLSFTREQVELVLPYLFGKIIPQQELTSVQAIDLLCQMLARDETVATLSTQQLEQVIHHITVYDQEHQLVKQHLSMLRRLVTLRHADLQPEDQQRLITLAQQTQGLYCSGNTQGQVLHRDATNGFFAAVITHLTHAMTPEQSQELGLISRLALFAHSEEHSSEEYDAMLSSALEEHQSEDPRYLLKFFTHSFAHISSDALLTNLRRIIERGFLKEPPDFCTPKIEITNLAKLAQRSSPELRGAIITEIEKGKNSLGSALIYFFWQLTKDACPSDFSEHELNTIVGLIDFEHDSSPMEILLAVANAQNKLTRRHLTTIKNFALPLLRSKHRGFQFKAQQLFDKVTELEQGTSL